MQFNIFNLNFQYIIILRESTLEIYFLNINYNKKHDANFHSLLLTFEADIPSAKSSFDSI